MVAVGSCENTLYHKSDDFQLMLKIQLLIFNSNLSVSSPMHEFKLK